MRCILRCRRERPNIRLTLIVEVPWFESLAGQFLFFSFFSIFYCAFYFSLFLFLLFFPFFISLFRLFSVFFFSRRVRFSTGAASTKQDRW